MAIGNTSFDYVIVGGGNAGLTIASRLSEQQSVRVAVIEAGNPYEYTSGNFSSIPGNDVYYNGKDPDDTNPLLDWGFTTIPQAGIGNAVVHYARGKTLGGCTALNYMGYQRTTKGALQRWADEVNDQSWAYENVSQYDNKSLSFAPTDMSKRIGNATPYYDTSTLGNNSPLKLAYTNYTQAISTLFSKLLEAVDIMLVHGFTSGALNGSAFLMGTINHTVGNRDSSERAFLRPFLDQPNLSVFNGMLAEKIVFDGVTARAVQVSYSNATKSYLQRTS